MRPKRKLATALQSNLKLSCAFGIFFSGLKIIITWLGVLVPGAHFVSVCLNRFSKGFGPMVWNPSISMTVEKVLGFPGGLEPFKSATFSKVLSPHGAPNLLIWITFARFRALPKQRSIDLYDFFSKGSESPRGPHPFDLQNFLKGSGRPWSLDPSICLTFKRFWAPGAPNPSIFINFGKVPSMLVISLLIFKLFQIVLGPPRAPSLLMFMLFEKVLGAPRAPNL